MQLARQRALAFVTSHTVLARPPLVPELELYGASEVTPLWQVSQAWLDAQPDPSAADDAAASGVGGEVHRGVEPPYWAFAWAGGQALARYVLDRPELVRGQVVLDFACGGGLVAIAAHRAGAARVIAVDTDPLALAAAQLNAEVNGARLELLQDDLLARPPSGFDVVLAGDVFFDAGLARRLEPWLRAAAARGAVVRVGDPGRSYVPADFEVLARFDVPVPLDLEGTTLKSTAVLRPAGDSPRS